MKQSSTSPWVLKCYEVYISMMAPSLQSLAFVVGFYPRPYSNMYIPIDGFTDTVFIMLIKKNVY